MWNWSWSSQHRRTSSTNLKMSKESCKQRLHLISETREFLYHTWTISLFIIKFLTSEMIFLYIKNKCCSMRRHVRQLSISWWIKFHQVLWSQSSSTHLEPQHCGGEDFRFKASMGYTVSQKIFWNFQIITRFRNNKHLQSPLRALRVLYVLLGLNISTVSWHWSKITPSDFLEK